MEGVFYQGLSTRPKIKCNSPPHSRPETLRVELCKRGTRPSGQKGNADQETRTKIVISKQLSVRSFKLSLATRYLLLLRVLIDTARPALALALAKLYPKGQRLAEGAASPTSSRSRKARRYAVRGADLFEIAFW